MFTRFSTGVLFCLGHESNGIGRRVVGSVVDANMCCSIVSLFLLVCWCVVGYTR